MSEPSGSRFFGAHSLGGSGACQLEIFGTPAPQGSKRGYIVAGRVNMVESSSAVKPWREAVAFACIDQPKITDIRQAVAVHVAFRFIRPRTSKLLHPGRRQGDLDKLLRATYDGLVIGGIIPDDSQIQGGSQTKRWTQPGEMSGASLTLELLY